MMIFELYYFAVRGMVCLSHELRQIITRSSSLSLKFRRTYCVNGARAKTMSSVTRIDLRRRQAWSSAACVTGNK